jgi:hypothetical protein
MEELGVIGEASAELGVMVWSRVLGVRIGEGSTLEGMGVGVVPPLLPAQPCHPIARARVRLAHSKAGQMTCLGLSENELLAGRGCPTGHGIKLVRSCCAWKGTE